MNEHGKSDRPEVPEKSSNKAKVTAARRGREEVWPKGTRTSKTRSGRRAGETRPVRWSGYAKWQAGIRQ